MQGERTAGKMIETIFFFRSTDAWQLFGARDDHLSCCQCNKEYSTPMMGRGRAKWLARAKPRVNFLASELFSESSSHVGKHLREKDRVTLRNLAAGWGAVE